MNTTWFMENSKKKYLLSVVIIFCIALIVRFVHFFLIQDNPVFLNPIIDAQQYSDWAMEILKKDWLSRDFDFQSPGYPYFLSLIYLLFGVSVKAVAIIQFIFGSINCVLIFLLAKTVLSSQNQGNRKFNLSQPAIDLIGFIAALSAAFYGASIFYEGLLLKVVLINFCNLMMLLMLLNGFEKSHKKYYYLAGLFLGFSYFLRPNILLFLPFVFLWLLLIKPLNLKKKIVYILLIFAGIFTVSTPFWIRNYSINNEFVVASGHGGINFFIGNNPSAKGIYEGQYFFTPDTKNEHDDFVNEACKRTGKQLTTMEASDYWYGQAYDFIFTKTGQWIKLLIKKFFIFFNAYEIPVNGLEYHQSKNYFPWLKLPFLNFAILAPLALLGMMLLFNVNNKVNLLQLFVLINILNAVIFFNCSELRFPVVIAFFVFAPYTVYWFYEKYREKGYLKISLAFLGLIPLILLVNNAKYKVEDTGLRGSLYNALGTVYAKQQDYDQAIMYYKNALLVSPNSPEINLNLANALVKKGMYEEAIEEYNSTLRILKGYLPETQQERIDSVAIAGSLPLKRTIFDIHLRLGETYIMTSQFEAAKEQFIAALKIDSLSEYALCDLGVVYANLQQYDEATLWLKKSLKINPDQKTARNALIWIEEQKK